MIDQYGRDIQLTTNTDGSTTIVVNGGQMILQVESGVDWQTAVAGIAPAGWTPADSAKYSGAIESRQVSHNFLDPSNGADDFIIAPGAGSKIEVSEVALIYDDSINCEANSLHFAGTNQVKPDGSLRNFNLVYQGRNSFRRTSNVFTYENGIWKLRWLYRTPIKFQSSSNGQLKISHDNGPWAGTGEATVTVWYLVSPE